MKKLTDKELEEENIYRKQKKFKEYGKVKYENTLDWLIEQQIKRKEGNKKL